MFSWFHNRKAPAVNYQAKRAPMQGVVDIFTRLFNASKKDRTALGWKTGLEHIDLVIQQELSSLVTRSRFSYSNHSTIRKFIKMRVRHVVGSQGIQLQVKSSVPDYNTATEKAFERWAKRCDVTGRLNFRQVQACVVRSMDMDGEAFIIIHESSKGLSLQLIDSQRVPSALMATKADGSRIVNGIEVDSFGKPIAYYFTKEDTPFKAYQSYGSDRDYDRVVAQHVLHLFVPEFVGQKRGIPATATALVNMYHLEKYTFATLLNARSSANKGLVLQSNYAVDIQPEDSFDENGEKVESAPDKIIQNTEEGEIMVLPDGYTAVTHNPTYPSGEFGAFKKEILKDVASGLDVSHASLASDGESVNFSTLRHFTLDERDEYTLGQQTIIDDLCAPIYERWLEFALLKGLIKLNGLPLKSSALEDLLNHEWQGRRWSWVDPLKDSSATMNNLRSLTKSFGQTIREQGRDPQDVYAEIASDLRDMAQAGIPQPAIDQFFGTALTVNIQEGNQNV
ncbi:MAG: phage portal protein [Vampirovibrio sp.]